MEEERVDVLFAKGEALMEELCTAVDKKDGATQLAIARKMAEVAREMEAVKAEMLAKLAEVVGTARTAQSDTDRVAKLIAAFRFCAQLAAFGFDDMPDPELDNAGTVKGNEIAAELEKIPPGRIVLAPLLDDADPRIRAFAGAHLVSLMPDRVLPMLKEIARTERWTKAGFVATLALVGADRKIREAGQRT